MYLNIVPEGKLEEAVLKRLIAYSAPHIMIQNTLLERKSLTANTKAAGRDSLRLNIRRYIQAAENAGTSFIVLCDLERDYPCPPELLQDWGVGTVPSNFSMNIAVRSTDAWLMADREQLAQFLSIAKSQIPARPDEIENAKRTLTNLAAKSRKVNIRKAFTPGKGRASGPGYASYIREYVQSHWRIQNAADASPSLARAAERIQSLGQALQNSPDLPMN